MMSSFGTWHHLEEEKTREEEQAELRHCQADFQKGSVSECVASSMIPDTEI